MLIIFASKVLSLQSITFYTKKMKNGWKEEEMSENTKNLFQPALGRAQLMKPGQNTQKHTIVWRH